MKPSAPNFTSLAAAFLVSASAAFSQTTATTDPVGFVTLNVTGGSGNAALTFKSLGLFRPVEYQGSAETATGGTAIVIDADATTGYGITPSASTPYFLEIVSGPAAGTTYDVSSITNTNQINLVQNLAASVTAPVNFKLRKHWTLASAFGLNNDFGLTGGTATSADTISVYVQDTGGGQPGYLTYYYQTQGFGTGWRKSGAPAVDASNTVIYPDDGLIIKRANGTTVPVVLTGAVKTGSTSIPISTGLNIVTNPYAAPMTLNSSMLRTGNDSTGVAGGTATSADQVSIWNGNGYDVYYYQTQGFGTGWRKSGVPATDVGDTAQIPTGAAVLIKRNGSPFNWVAPQHPATL